MNIDQQNFKKKQENLAAMLRTWASNVDTLKAESEAWAQLDYWTKALSKLPQPMQQSSTAKLPKCHIKILGKFIITPALDKHSASLRLPKIPLSLLLHLIAAGDIGLSRNALVDRLWPDAGWEKGHTRLKTTLYRLRTLLGCGSAIQQFQGNLCINSQFCTVDCWVFENWYKAASLGDIEKAVLAIELYQGAFDDSLTDDETLHFYRIYLERIYGELVSLLAEHYQTKGAFTTALAIYQKALELDPANEVFCSGLLKLLDALGRTGEMQKIFECYWLGGLNESVTN